VKITELRTIVVGNPWKNWVFVEVHTDEGITGLGEATGGLSSRPHEAGVRELEVVVVGQDPMNARGLWLHMEKALYFASSPAMAAVEIACWDIIGKVVSAPVWQLLGGATQPRIRAYANGWYSGERSPTAIAELASQVVAQGYTALKLDPFGTAYKFITKPELRAAMAIVEAIREAVGADVDIMIEAHDRFTVQTAIEVGRTIAAIDPFWLEAPVISTDPVATNAVARAVPVRVAAGERFSRPTEFAELLHDRVVDIAQPELLNCGGIQGLLAAAAVASSYDAFVAPHNAQSPFTTVVNTHVGATLPNLLVQESFDDFLEPWSHDLMTGACRVKDGYIELPEGPGFGVSFREEEMVKHPYSDRNFLRLFSGGWERRGGDR
jgi:galactonate dehydratase